ncbi:MAG: DUF2497 domain-containing protein [Hyphomicrobiaceae bacterium]|nr:DUF2497 domain-containing protein [Hyphomicrobiaceae bacterium]
MSRPEAAAEPSMEEILASIRKIIAEEPGGARPLPDRARNLSGGFGSTSQPAKSQTAPDRFGMGGGLREPQPPAANVPEPQRRAPMPYNTSAPQAPRGVGAPEPGGTSAAPKAATRSSMPHLPPRNDGADDALFGRLADALRGGMSAPAADVTARGEPGSGNAGDRAAAGERQEGFDIDELLDDAAGGTAGSAAPNDARPSSKTNEVDVAGLMAKSSSPVDRDEDGGGRIADLGAFVPSSDTIILGSEVPAQPAARADEPADAALIAEPAGEKNTDANPPTEDSLAHSGQTDDATVEASDEAPATAEGKVDDQAASEDARDVFGALMAGLAAASQASAAAKQAGASTPAHTQAEDRSEQQDAEMDDNGSPEPDSVAVGSEDNSAAFANAAADEKAAVARKSPKVVAADVTFGKKNAGTASEQTAFAPLPPPPSSPPPQPAVQASQPQQEPVAVAVQPAQSAPAQVTMPKPDERLLAAAAAPKVSSEVRPPAEAAAPEAASKQGLPEPALPAVASAGEPTVASTPLGAVGVRTVEDIVADLLRPMLREWLAENMPRMVEKALRIELADGLKTINQRAPKIKREEG